MTIKDKWHGRHDPRKKISTKIIRRCFKHQKRSFYIFIRNFAFKKTDHYEIYLHKHFALKQSYINQSLNFDSYKVQFHHRVHTVLWDGLFHPIPYKVFFKTEIPFKILLKIKISAWQLKLNVCILSHSTQSFAGLVYSFVP